jgi:hypothetical protein
MKSRRGDNSGVFAAYQKYKTDARGWGVPAFKGFREQLWPLRGQRDRARWPDDSMFLVMRLQEDGAGWALQRLFTSGGRINPVAVELLGAGPLTPEAVARDELDGHLQALIRDCKANMWSPGEFGAYIDYLDSRRTPSDLGEARRGQAAAAAGSAGDAERDLFAEIYRAAGVGYQRRVRELLAAAAEKNLGGSVAPPASPVTSPPALPPSS